MAMRDPGTPGRNPFFGAEGPADGAGGGEAGVDPSSGAPGFGAPGFDALGGLVALVDALTSAQPEAAEHLVAAAHEVVLAVKTVVDATELVLAEQHAAMRAAREAQGGAPDPPAGVHRLDLG